MNAKSYYFKIHSYARYLLILNELSWSLSVMLAPTGLNSILLIVCCFLSFSPSLPFSSSPSLSPSPSSSSSNASKCASSTNPNFFLKSSWSSFVASSSSSVVADMNTSTLFSAFSIKDPNLSGHSNTATLVFENVSSTSISSFTLFSSGNRYRSKWCTFFTPLLFLSSLSFSYVF